MRRGQLAEIARTTTRTVRHYHRFGLLNEPQRRSNGYRTVRPFGVTGTSSRPSRCRGTRRRSCLPNGRISWSHLEGRNPDSTEPEIDALAAQLLEFFDQQKIGIIEPSVDVVEGDGGRSSNTADIRW